VLAFCDANARWAPDALTALVGAFADPAVGYACGDVGFVRAGAPGAPNQEGAYWKLELATRRLESDWHSVTAGNGAIYAVRASLWPRLRTDLGHDLSLPTRSSARVCSPSTCRVRGPASSWSRRSRGSGGASGG
jgi:hypothetical protein